MTGFMHARLAYSKIDSALHGLAAYLEDPCGDDLGRPMAHLQEQVRDSLRQLQNGRELLDGPDSLPPPAALLALVQRACDVALDVDCKTEAKKYAARAIGNFQDARSELGQVD